jgi:hypothetical protein
MKLSELKTAIDVAIKNSRTEDFNAVIEVTMPYATVGGTPTVGIKSAHLGFDWNHGKFFIVPDVPLSEPDSEFQKQFGDLQKKCGLLDYENRNLKSEVKKLKNQIKCLDNDAKS